MISNLLITLLMVALVNAGQCPSNGPTSCVGLSQSTCGNSYFFDGTNYRVCYWTPDHGGGCNGDDVYSSICYLSCTNSPPQGYGRTGGPNGQICLNFGYLEAACLSYYAYNNGADRVCQWNPSGYCQDGQTCWH